MSLGTDHVVSESRLLTLLRAETRGWMDGDALARPEVVLDPAALLDRWREGLKRQVKRLTKRSRGMLEVLSGDALYSTLDDPTSRQAALVAELFRDHSISKNAGRLDVRSLQRRLIEPLRSGAPLRLEIALGQPKRDAGGLKTAGPSADLAELYAIGRLVALTESVAELAEHDDVRLTVLSGGGRFGEALLTSSEPRALYDTQRQRIADAVTTKTSLEFREFSSSRDDEWRGWFDRELAALTQEQVSGKLYTVLLNVDWENVLALAASGRWPHDVGLTAALSAWLADAPDERGALLTRAAVSSIVNPRHQAAWQQEFADDTVLDDGIAFFASVALEATRRYLAIHAADRRMGSTRSDGIRLSVHEKRDRADLPALLTLGPRGGNLLSHHVMALVRQKEPVRFLTVAEVTAGEPDAVPVRVRSSSPGLFDWLSGRPQPLCFAHGPDAEHAVGAVLEPDLG